jgi:hypothetical protein
MVGFIICMIVLFLLINFGITLYIVSEREHKKDMEEYRKGGLH